MRNSSTWRLAFVSSLAITGSAAADLVQLSHFTSPNAYVRSFEYAPGAGRIVFSEDVNADNSFNPDVRSLFSVVPNQPSTLLRVSSPIMSHSERILDWKLSPDGTRVIMRGELDGAGLIQLFTASTTQEGTQTRLDSSTAPWHDYAVPTDQYEITPDGSRVIFRARIDGAWCLLSAPVTGGPAINLSPVSSADVTYFELLPDGTQVVYTSDIEGSEWELYLASTDQEGSSVRITDLQAGSAYIDGDKFAVSGDGSEVLYVAKFHTANPGQFLRRPIHPLGTQTAITTNTTPAPPAVNGTTIQSFLRPDAQNRVAFAADRANVSFHQVFAKIDSVLDPFMISSGGSGSVVPGSLTHVPGSSRVLYTGNLTNLPTMDLYSASMDSAGTQIQISQRTHLLAEIHQFDATPNGARVVYSGDLEHNGQSDLYSAEVATAGTQVRLFDRDSSQTLYRWALSPDGSRVIYTLLTSSPLAFDVHSVAANGSSATEKIADFTGLGVANLTQVGFTPSNIPIIGGNQLFSVSVPPPPANQRPKVSINGKKKPSTRKSRVTVRGKASDPDGKVQRVEVKAGKAKFKKAKGTGKWRFNVRVRARKTPVTARAIDNQGAISKPAKIQIRRKP